MAATNNPGLLMAMLKHKCPKCRKGSMFKYKNSQLNRNLFAANERCPHCGIKFEIEPGFFYGAMYISYAMSVAIILTTGFILYILGDPGVWVYIGTNITILILLMPFIFRYARVFMLYGFGGIQYEPPNT